MKQVALALFVVILATGAVCVVVVGPGASAVPGTTERVSVDSAGNQGNNNIWGLGSDLAAISADGRFVAFQSVCTNLVPSDTNDWEDTFVHDRLTGSTERVSVDSAGNQGNSVQAYPITRASPALSADGRYVAFLSLSSNLVPGDTNGVGDVFVRDRQTGVTQRVSVASDGNQSDRSSLSAAISADGRYVAFQSGAYNLVPGDTSGNQHVFVHDRQTGITERVSVDSEGNAGHGGSWPPPDPSVSISADGRFVAFASEFTNLVQGDANGRADVFVHDRKTGTTERVSVDSSGGEGDWFEAVTPAISADGRYVAFAAPWDNGYPGDMWVHDRQTGATEMVSVDSAGNPGNWGSEWPAISADGRFVAFQTDANNLVPGDTSYDADIFVHDRQTGVTERVSVDSAGNQANHWSYRPAISADGRFVAFESRASNLVPGDTNGVWDVFVRDRFAGPTPTPTPTATVTPTPTPTPTPGAEDRKVIFIQGIDSESGKCGEDFVKRVSWMVDYLTTNSWVRDRVPSLDSTEDFFYFSYSDTDAFCLGTNGLQDFQQPQYDNDDTCDGVADAANRLNTLVGALIYQYPNANFDIVTHSMGGMVAAYWLRQHEDVRSRVNSVVTFDSPLRGIPFGAPLSALPGPCDQSTSQSQRDLTCGDYGQSDNRDVCTSEIVSAIQDIGDSVPFFTIDATQHAGPVEAVPRDRTTLLSSNSKLHCQFDDGHSSAWENGGLGGGDPLNCWVNFSWPTDPDDSPGTPTTLNPVADAKKVFVACAVTAPSDPSACIQKLGSPRLPDGTLSEPTLAGSTELQFADTSAFAVGDRILINPGMPNEEENEVVGFGSILLASPLQFDHQAGEPVVKLSSPPSMVAGWNQACYLGAEQPIEDALADIAGDVLAVYRLNSSQTFDRWFPSRPEVSTITTVAPYQPLFVLTANDAAWPQAPTETPPTSTSLVQGWNSVCYAGQTKPVGEATAGMAGNFSILYRLGNDQAWGRFVPGRPEVSSISDLNTYDPVLILVTATGGAQWVFDP